MLGCKGRAKKQMQTEQNLQMMQCRCIMHAAATAKANLLLPATVVGTKAVDFRKCLPKFVSLHGTEGVSTVRECLKLIFVKKTS
jgi:hypothetical protein